MNALSLIKQEILKPLLTLVLPGLIFVIPFWILIYENLSIFNFDFFSEIHVFLLILFALCFGLIFEDFGSRIEIYLISRLFIKDIDQKNSITVSEYQIPKEYIDQHNYSILKKNLEEYLKPVTQNKYKYIFRKYLYDEINSEKKVGVTYINSIVLRMKFELGLLASILVSTFPWIYILKFSFCLSSLQVFAIISIVDFTFIYILSEAFNSVAFLHKLRENVVTGTTDDYDENFLRAFFADLCSCKSRRSLYLGQSWLIVIFISLSILCSFISYRSICVATPSINDEYLVDTGILIKYSSFNVDESKIKYSFSDEGECIHRTELNQDFPISNINTEQRQHVTRIIPKEENDKLGTRYIQVYEDDNGICKLAKEVKVKIISEDDESSTSE